jgi:hypothetical protein
MYQSYTCVNRIARNWKYYALLLIGIAVGSLLLQSCASFIPVEVEQGRALGVMPMQYGRISYQSTHAVNASREEIFRAIRRWVAFHSNRTVYTTYTALKIPNPTAAFNVSDNIIGDVIGTGTIDPILIKPKNPQTYPGANYSVSVEANEGYYRLTLTNFYTFGFPSPHYLDYRDKSTGYKKNKEFYTRLDSEVAKLIVELEKFVATETVRVSTK